MAELKKKKDFLKCLHFSTAEGKHTWVELSHQIHPHTETGAELSPAGDVLVEPKGCSGVSWLGSAPACSHVTLIKSCNLKTQEREITSGPTCFSCPLCYPFSLTCTSKSKKKQ